jgi:hypothetical protein
MSTQYKIVPTKTLRVPVFDLFDSQNPTNNVASLNDEQMDLWTMYATHTNHNRLNTFTWLRWLTISDNMTETYLAQQMFIRCLTPEALDYALKHDGSLLTESFVRVLRQMEPFLLDNYHVLLHCGMVQPLVQIYGRISPYSARSWFYGKSYGGSKTIHLLVQNNCLTIASTKSTFQINGSPQEDHAILVIH